MNLIIGLKDIKLISTRKHLTWSLIDIDILTNYSDVPILQ